MKNLSIILILIAIVNVSCEKEVTGCTNELASNYNPYATEDCCCLIDESILRDRYLGDFYLNENCDNGYEGSYRISIRTNSENRLFITNFAGLGNQFVLEAVLVGSELEVDDKFTYENCTYSITGNVLRLDDNIQSEYRIASVCANFDLSCSASN